MCISKHFHLTAAKIDAKDAEIREAAAALGFRFTLSFGLPFGLSSAFNAVDLIILLDPCLIQNVSYSFVYCDITPSRVLLLFCYTIGCVHLLFILKRVF